MQGVLNRRAEQAERLLTNELMNQLQHRNPYDCFVACRRVFDIVGYFPKDNPPKSRVFVRRLFECNFKFNLSMEMYPSYIIVDHIKLSEYPLEKFEHTINFFDSCTFSQGESLRDKLVSHLTSGDTDKAYDALFFIAENKNQRIFDDRFFELLVIKDICSQLPFLYSTFAHEVYEIWEEVKERCCYYMLKSDISQLIHNAKNNIEFVQFSLLSANLDKVPPSRELIEEIKSIYSNAETFTNVIRIVTEFPFFALIELFFRYKPFRFRRLSLQMLFPFDWVVEMLVKALSLMLLPTLCSVHFFLVKKIILF